MQIIAASIYDHHNYDIHSYKYIVKLIFFFSFTCVLVIILPRKYKTNVKKIIIITIIAITFTI